MFPLNSNDQYIDSNGKRSKLGDAIGSGGEQYELPPATALSLGGVKIGNGLSVTEDGTISVSGGGGATIHVHSFPNKQVVAGGGQLGIKVPGTYDLTNCIMFATYGACTSFSKLYIPLIYSVDTSTRDVVLHTESGSNPTPAEIILVVVEP